MKLRLAQRDQQGVFLAQKSLGNSVTARRFATELVAAVNKVNYNQDSGLNAFAGSSVPLAPSTRSHFVSLGPVCSYWTSNANHGMFQLLLVPAKQAIQLLF